MPLEQSSAVLAFPSPGVFDARRFPLGLLSLIIGGGMASRLFVEVRERRGLTYGIDAGETAYSDAGLWSVEWQCAPGKLTQILELVRGSLHVVAPLPRMSWREPRARCAVKRRSRTKGRAAG